MSHSRSTVLLKEANCAGFRRYQAQILKNARAMSRVLAARGLQVVGGGTENHLMVLDVSGQGLTGQEAADLLEEASIVVSKQVIPGDPRPPAVTSGIRLGSPAITTRGLREAEVAQLSEWIVEILKRPREARLRKAIASQVRKLARKFPIY